MCAGKVPVVVGNCVGFTGTPYIVWHVIIINSYQALLISSFLAINFHYVLLYISSANRVFFPYGQAARFLADRGIDIYRMDRVMKQFGMPMGPFEMSDLAGVDIGVFTGKILGKVCIMHLLLL